jgi:hypothetical protein
MTNFIHKNRLYLFGALIGGSLGFAYYYWIGCVSGTCAITSDPLKSILYGSLLGALFLGLFKRS